MTQPFYRPATLLRLMPTVLAVLLFGLLVPTVMGFGFLEPSIQLLYACLGPFFLSRPLEKHPPVIAALRAWVAALFTHAVAIIGLSGRMAPGYWLTPDWRFLLGAAAAGFGLIVFAALLGARWGGAALRRGFLFLLLALAIAGQIAPESVQSTVRSALVPENALIFGPMAAVALLGLGLLLKRRGTL